MANLPKNYREYSIVLEKGVVVTPADIDAILTWRTAEVLEINDNADVAYELSLRPTTKQRVLTSIVFTVQRHSYKALKVNSLVDKYLTQQGMLFRPAFHMTPEEMKEFVANQSGSFMRRTTVSSNGFKVNGIM